MARDQFLDEIFNTIVNHLENQFLKHGTSAVKTNLSEFSKEEIDQLVWETEEQYDMQISDIEINECFSEAFDYVNEIYRITATNHLEDYITFFGSVNQCMSY